MDLQAEKEYIKRELDKVDDKYLIEAIRNMLEFGKTKAMEQRLYPMSQEEFYERNALSRSAIDQNQLIAQEEVKAYFKKKHGG